MQPPTPTQKAYAQGDLGTSQLTLEEVLEFLPPNLRPFMVMHDFDEDFNAYPALGAHDDPNADGYFELWVSIPLVLAPIVRTPCPVGG